MTDEGLLAELRSRLEEEEEVGSSSSATDFSSSDEREAAYGIKTLAR